VPRASRHLPRASTSICQRTARAPGPSRRSAAKADGAPASGPWPGPPNTPNIYTCRKTATTIFTFFSPWRPAWGGLKPPVPRQGGGGPSSPAIFPVGRAFPGRAMALRRRTAAGSTPALATRRVEVRGGRGRRRRSVGGLRTASRCTGFTHCGKSIAKPLDREDEILA
jgi:hypothetical protein